MKSISDTQILITDRDGFTRQINVTSKPDGVAVGTRIHAEGTVNADGVSLNAGSVVVATERVGELIGPQDIGAAAILKMPAAASNARG